MPEAEIHCKVTKLSRRRSLVGATTPITANNTAAIENELHQSRNHALLQVNLKCKTMVRLHGDRSSLLSALIWATARHKHSPEPIHPSPATNRNLDPSDAKGPKN